MRAAFGALRWPPEVFWKSTLTEFLDAIEGFSEANGSEKSEAPPSDQELDALVARYGA